MLRAQPACSGLKRGQEDDRIGANAHLSRDGHPEFLDAIKDLLSLWSLSVRLISLPSVFIYHFLNK